jgi:hypothetical protein
MDMFENIFGTALVVALTAGPLAWRILHDRREERALATKAEIQAAVSRVFGGESFLTIKVVPPILGRAGRVVLSVPRGDEWLVRTAWNALVAKVPRSFELVVRHA